MRCQVVVELLGVVPVLPVTGLKCLSHPRSPVFGEMKFVRHRVGARPLYQYADFDREGLAGLPEQ